jgi:hypothetical protein
MDEVLPVRAEIGPAAQLLRPSLIKNQASNVIYRHVTAPCQPPAAGQNVGKQAFSGKMALGKFGMLLAYRACSDSS